jgi:dienelactone hydrolase
MSRAKHDELADFEREELTLVGQRRAVYFLGGGPGVVVMSEIPGITPRVADFARRVAAAGFTVAMPHLFGIDGKAPHAGYVAGSMARACISREFRMFSTGGTSEITRWCRALARELHTRCGGPGVGAIGMCLTGNFALAMMLDDALIAPVLSQPSLPVGPLASQKRDLHIGEPDLVQIRERSAREGIPILGLRFTGDLLCPKERFERLRECFGSRFEGIEIDSRRGNPDGIPGWAHSVVTEHLVDTEGHPTRRALERVIEFFTERLGPADAASSANS